MASGKKTVIAALAGNSVIGVCKFIAFAFSGSGAMLSEAIHSVADVTNQALLLLGIKRSEAAATREYSYGYGSETFFWALISAVGIFFLGCGVTIYHGIHTLTGDHLSHPGMWDYGILTMSLVIEGWTLWVAVKGINVDRKDVPFMKFLRESADPTPIAVLLEDAAACLGLMIALIGILCGQIYESSIPDGIASITIGVLLGFVAVFLIYKNHGLIIGMSVDQNVEKKVVDYLQSRSSVERILDFKSRVLSANRFHVKMEIEFHGEIIADKLLEEVDLEKLRKELNDEETFRAYLRKFADEVIEELGDEVDRIETDLRKEVPEAQHIDIETD
jgi:solute carrier family 30 (zinc transporter), member 9